MVSEIFEREQSRLYAMKVDRIVVVRVWPFLRDLLAVVTLVAAAAAMIWLAVSNQVWWLAFVAAVVGHSIFNRTSTVNVAELLARHGGGGHARAGATPLALDTAEESIQEILEDLQSG